MFELKIRSLPQYDRDSKVLRTAGKYFVNRVLFCRDWLAIHVYWGNVFFALWHVVFSMIWNRTVEKFGMSDSRGIYFIYLNVGWINLNRAYLCHKYALFKLMDSVHFFIIDLRQYGNTEMCINTEFNIFLRISHFSWRTRREWIMWW